MSNSDAAPLSLVTGACGFMGSTVVELLLDAGHRVRATDLDSVRAGGDDPRRGRYPSAVCRPGVDFRGADITRPSTLEGIARDVDYVFHTAAVFDYSTPKAILDRVNVEGTRNLVDEVLRERGRANGSGRFRRFILWGAGGVYGFPENGRPFSESDGAAEDPPNDYLRSKRAQESFVEDTGRDHGMAWTTIRPTTVYGPRGVYGAGQLIMSAAKMKVLAVPVNFSSRIPWVHVRDVARSALHLALHPEAAGEYFNINDDTQMTEAEYFKFMAAILGKPFVPLPPVPTSLLRTGLLAVARASAPVFKRIGKKPPLEADAINYMARDIFFTNDKLKGTGFQFEYPDARIGLRDTLRWYKQEGWL